MVSGRFRSRVFLAAVLAGAVTLTAATDGALGAIREGDLKEWLSYIASDELEGRALYSTGLGLAAGYLEHHLRMWNATPAGDTESFLQTVRVLGVKSTNRSTLTVEVRGQTRTFTDGDGVTFPRNVGTKRRFTVDRVEFAGYGLDVPRARHVDLGSKDVRGAAVVWLGDRGPRDVDTSLYRVLLASRDRYAIQQLQAAATIGPGRTPGPGRAGGAGQAGGAAGRGRGNQTSGVGLHDR